VRTIYFDFNATTPLDPGVRDAMLPYLDNTFGNPSSVHHVGRAARAALDGARERVAVVLGCKPSEVLFTSGGTESINLAILGTARRLRAKGSHIITSAIEHHAALHACNYLREREGFRVTYLPVDRDGRVAVESLREAIRPDTILVSTMAANNEVGTLQPVAELGALCRKCGVLFHTDAVQWFGKEALPSVHWFNADLVSACAHKFHGPKGVGVLYARSLQTLDPVLFGGGHEHERRAGTENLAAIIGLAEALERFVPNPVFAQGNHVQVLRDSLRTSLENIEGVQVVSPQTGCLPNTVAFVAHGCDSSTVLAGLDLEGVCASSGSACSAGSVEPSHVVTAMGLPLDLGRALVRFSLGRESTEDEVRTVSACLQSIITRIRSVNIAE
jgi:cysteine desulfurase